MQNVKRKERYAMKFEHLFTPGKIGTMEVKNRLIVPPMLTEYAAEDGSLTDRFIRYYEEKAKGGWGLIICEDTSVDEFGAGFKNLPGIWKDEFIPRHKELTDRVHQYGAKIAVQAYHAGRESNSSIKGRRPVAPSAIQDPTEPETPHELTTAEVKELVEKFAQGIRRAQDAGYDAVELHGAHGYLINQFVSPFSNKRTDEYGGNFLPDRLQLKPVAGKGPGLLGRFPVDCPRENTERGCAVLDGFGDITVLTVDAAFSIQFLTECAPDRSRCPLLIAFEFISYMVWLPFFERIGDAADMQHARDLHGSFCRAF